MVFSQNTAYKALISVLTITTVFGFPITVVGFPPIVVFCIVYVGHLPRTKPYGFALS